jgi:hypothetical protein
MGTSTHFDTEVTVALQGTLDTFALPDVLRLLAATKKSGRLRITGGRGSGDVWVTGGGVSAIEASHAPHATELVDALFELLRFEEGSFAFEADVAHDDSGPTSEVDALLDRAEDLLTEWRQISAVVPSLDAFVTLRRTLEAPTVSITQDHWTTLVAVGGGSAVRGIGDGLGLSEIAVSRAIRDLVELGVVEIEAVAPAGTAEVPIAGAAASSPGPPPLAPHAALDPPAMTLDLPPLVLDRAEPAPLAPTDVAAEPAAEDALPVARPLRARRPKTRAETEDGPQEPERFVPIEVPGTGSAVSHDEESAHGEVAADDLAAAFPGLANRTAEPSPEDEELVRQMATLSPRAAQAVRAAALAATDEERDAALDEAAEEGDGSINRGLLLKFLSSVKS